MTMRNKFHQALEMLRLEHPTWSKDRLCKRVEEIVLAVARAVVDNLRAGDESGLLENPKLKKFVDEVRARLYDDYAQSGREIPPALKKPS